jgi:negative regulator of flagellin synthesis FlgM
MKIENSVSSSPVLNTTGNNVKASKAEVVAAQPSNVSSTVQLSTKLQIVEGQASSAGVFDAQKVQDIKAAIAEGRFQINSDVIADGLMATVKDLIRSHSRTA